MATTMVPSADRLPDVLPTERLNESGMPVPPLRQELRGIANLRNVGSVVLTWGQALATIGVAVWVNHAAVWVAAFLLMGPAYARFAILGHEAAHRLLFTRKRWNDVVGRWLLAYPAFIPFEAYRRSHFAHHRDEFGPDEPDLNLYEGYPVPPDSFWRKMRRDALGVSGWKNLKPLLGALGSPAGRPVASRILVTQLVLLAGFTMIGRPELYFLLWLGPWMTVWRVINRLRSIAEHGGMQRSEDRRQTTHHVESQSWWVRFTVVPFNTGWHLAHHVDMGVPWRNLPALHRELVGAGWVPPSITYRTYPQLWQALRRG